MPAFAVAALLGFGLSLLRLDPTSLDRAWTEVFSAASVGLSWPIALGLGALVVAAAALHPGAGSQTAAMAMAVCCVPLGALHGLGRGPGEPIFPFLAGATGGLLLGISLAVSFDRDGEETVGLGVALPAGMVGLFGWVAVLGWATEEEGAIGLFAKAVLAVVPALPLMAGGGAVTLGLVWLLASRLERFAVLWVGAVPGGVVGALLGAVVRLVEAHGRGSLGG